MTKVRALLAAVVVTATLTGGALTAAGAAQAAPTEQQFKARGTVWCC